MVSRLSVGDIGAPWLYSFFLKIITRTLATMWQRIWSKIIILWFQVERSWFLCNFVTPPFRFSHHICQAKHKPSISMAPHPINYQSAAPFHKSPQLDWLSLSPTRKMCPRCSTVTESSAICMPTTSRLTLTHHFSDVPTARATLQSCITDVGDWCSSRRLQLN